MDNSDQQNPTGTPLDITPTENTAVETTVTETPVEVTTTVTPPVQPVMQVLQPSTVQTTITSPAPPSMVAPVVTPMGVPTPPQESLTTQQTAVVTTESTPVLQQTPVTTETITTTPVVTTPSISTVQQTTETTTTTPITASTVTEVTGSETSESQLTSKKKGASPLVMGLLAVLFIGVAGGGLFAVSRAISSQQAIAPTAPISEPAAFESTDSALPDYGIPADDFDPRRYLEEDPTPPTGPAVDDDSIDCSTLPNTVAYHGFCWPTATDEQGNIYWISHTGN